MHAVHTSTPPLGRSALRGARRASAAGFYPWVSYSGLGVRLCKPHLIFPRVFCGLTRLALVSYSGKVAGAHFWITYGFIPKLAYEFVFRCLVVL